MILATVIAGDEEAGYIARTMIRLGRKWRVVTINGQEATGLLSTDDVRILIENGCSDIHEFSPPSGCSSQLPNASMGCFMSAVSTRTTVPKRWLRSCYR